MAHKHQPDHAFNRASWEKARRPGHVFRKCLHPSCKQCVTCNDTVVSVGHWHRTAAVAR